MIITLCGSSRFPEAFALANLHLSMAGHIVIGLACFGHADEPTGAKFLTDDGNPQVEVKQRLDELHRRKIDISDAIYVVNVGGYLGQSTRAEIGYANGKGKDIFYMFPGSLP